MSANPYAPPQADLGSPTREPADAGSLEAALRGTYRFGIGSVMSGAWRAKDGAKLTLLLALLVTTGASWLVTKVLALAGLDAQPYLQSGQLLKGYLVSFVIGAIGWPITAPLFAGAVMMSVRRAAGRPVGLGELFAYYGRLPAVLGLYVLQTVLVFVGFALLVLPGIYLAVSYSLAIPALLDKRLSPWQALEASRKAVGHHWLGIFALGLVVTVLTSLSLLPLLIPGIWTVPWALLCLGALYVTAFGVGPATLAAGQAQASSSSSPADAAAR
jgi:hypothetical protein